MGEGNSILVGGKRVDFGTLTIEGSDGPVSIEPKVMELLRMLVDNAGVMVSRQELLDTVWSENYGGDESLSRGISLLRRAFGDSRSSHDFIETVPKRGYRLVAEVKPDRPTKPHWLKHAIIAAAVIALAALLPRFFDGTETPSPTPTVPANSIAVLPFSDLSADGDQQYLSEGLAEEILNALLQLPGLQVSGRNSSFSFDEKEPDLAQIRATLAVSHVLSGSVRQQDNRVRITARLLQTSDGYTIWSENYDSTLDNIFSLQEDIAREIAGNLGVVLDLTESTPFPPRLTNNREAYDLFLQGRMLVRKFGHRNKLKASELLQRAVTLDPRFAAAWAWLGQAHIYLTLTVSEAEIPAQIDAAREAVDTALALHPELAMAHYTRSILLDYDLDFAASLNAHEKAYQLNPRDPLIAHRRGYARLVAGQSKAGAELMRDALRWDPTDAVGLLNLGVAQRASGQLSVAASSFQRSIDLGFVPSMVQPCVNFMITEEPQAAETCWNALPPTFRSRYQPLLDRSVTWEQLGRAQYGNDSTMKRKTLAALDEYLNQPSAHASTYLLHTYLWIDQPERFMQVYLDKPYPLNAGGLAGIWSDLEIGKNLRQHPGFPEFAQRLGLVTSWQKYGWPDKCQPYPGTDGAGGQFSCR